MPYISMTLPELMKRFDCEDKCWAYLEELRWPDGPRCPACNGENIMRIENRTRVLRCRACQHQFTATVGTIFHDSHLPLAKWFIAICLICQAKKGMSSLQLQRLLGIGYKTAWYLTHRIRQAMMNANGHGNKLAGIVEIDETYLGGKQHGKGRGTANKTVVMGIIERGGKLRLAVTADVTSKSLRRVARRYVSKNVELIISDELAAYVPALGPIFRHKYERICHARTYVDGIVHTNSIENAFSLLKRGIVGTWHKISLKHLQRYLEEVAFRFSERENPTIFSLTLLNLLSTKPLPFARLVRSKAA